MNSALHVVTLLPGPQAASVMDLPTQEGPGSSRDQAPVTYQLKVNKEKACHLLYITFIIGVS